MIMSKEKLKIKLTTYLQPMWLKNVFYWQASWANY